MLRKRVRLLSSFVPVCCVQATGNTLLYFAAAVSAIILTVVISLVFGWQLGLALLPLLPLTVVSGMFQGYMNTAYEVKSHSRTEESGRVRFILISMS